MARSSTTWKKGFAPNPNGRPKKEYSIVQTIKDMMATDPGKKRKLAEKIYEMAEKGDVVAMKTIIQYMDGMPHQTQDIDMNVSNVVVVPDEVYKKYGATQDTENSGGEQEEI